MLARDTAAEKIDVVSSRLEFLLLLRDTPMEKPELVDELDVSRSTVDRGLRELETLDLIEYSAHEGYKPTLCGRLLAQEYVRLQTTAARIDRTQELLLALPADVEFDPVVLEGADVIVANNAAPFVPGTVVEDLLRGAFRLRGLARAYSHPGAFEVFSDLVEDGTRVEVVFQKGMIEHLLDATATDVHRLLDAEHVDPYVIDDVPYGLFLVDHVADTTGCVLVYESDNHLKGVIANDTADALEWFEAVYESYKSRARSLVI